MKKTLQKLRLALGKALLDRKTAPASADFSPKKILFLRKDGKIGDFIVSSFVFREIKKQRPEIQIGVVCTPKNKSLLENNPYIDFFHLLPSRKIADHIKLGKSLAEYGYDTVIDPTVLLRNRDLLLLSMIKAKHYIGYKKSRYQLFNFSLESDVHFSEIYRQALEICGFHPVDSHYDIPQKSPYNENVQQFLTEHQLKDYIAINFFGAANSRKFNVQNINAFLDYFQQNLPHKSLLLLTYPDVSALLKACVSNRKNVFLYENTQSIFDSIELIRYADWVISPDTAIVHIASGLEKKIIGFYQKNDENWQNWHPNSQNECHILHFNKNINEITPTQIDLSWFK